MRGATFVIIEFRGRWFADGLMRVAARRILARWEMPVRHVYARNVGAVALYRALGFVVRRETTMSVVSGGGEDWR